MKLKFNYYTSHLLFVIAAYIITMFSNFMLERYWSGFTDIIVIGIWYWNYTITISAIEKFSDKYKGHLFLKPICILVLLINTITIAGGPISIFYPFIFLTIILEIYSILKFNSVIDKLKAWLKR